MKLLSINGLKATTMSLGGFACHLIQIIGNHKEGSLDLILQAISDAFCVLSKHVRGAGNVGLTLVSFVQVLYKGECSQICCKTEFNCHAVFLQV